MLARHLTLLFDARRLEHNDVVSWRTTFATQCGEFLSIARIQSCFSARVPQHQQKVLVSVHVIGDNNEPATLVSEAVLSASSSVSNETNGFNAILQALARAGAGTDAASLPHTAQYTQSDSMKPIVRFVYDNHQRHAARAGECPQLPSSSLLLIVSSAVPYGQAFQALAQVCTAGFGSQLHCHIGDASAVCLTHASLGPHSQLWRCSLSPTDSRAALERTLGRWLLRDGGEQRVSCRVRCGYLCFDAVAERPCVAWLDGCAAAPDFPTTQQEHPGLVLCGATAVHSPFELTRHSGTSPAVLSLTAVLMPEQVDDTWLCGGAWVISLPPACSSQDAAVCAAVHETFKGDALLFTTTQPHFDTAHALALPRSSFVGYFLNETRLFLRQVIPSELLAACVTSPAMATDTTQAFRRDPHDPALAARAQQVRVDLVAQSSQFNVRELLSGGLVQVASQLRPDAQFRLRLTR